MNLDEGGLQWFTSTPYTTALSTCTIRTSSQSTQLLNSKCKQVEPAYGTKTRMPQVGRSAASTPTGVEEVFNFCSDKSLDTEVHMKKTMTLMIATVTATNIIID